MGAYLLDDLWRDTGSGHNIVQTVFLECGASYRESGPEEMRPIGETEFVAAIAQASEEGAGATIAGIVSRADLRLGDAVEAVLDAHEKAAGGRFRGIRHAGAHAEHPEALMIPGKAPAGLFQDPKFREAVRALGRLGYTYDTWHYHYQNRDFSELARAAPETTMVLDHFGTPLGVGPYAAKRQEIFEDWKSSIAEVAQCENVVAKIGGLAMPDNGFGWDLRDTPPTSDEFVEAQRRYYLHTIDCFGPDRCMFESNFPIDRMSISYHVLYNGLKKIAASFSESEKDAMFSGTARRVYRL
jgi:predicted TIM-barrel fold metal-dependent hydrolase